jgi:hypothetical protein
MLRQGWDARGNGIIPNRTGADENRQANTVFALYSPLPVLPKGARKERQSRLGRPSGSQVCSQSAIGIGAEYNIQTIHTGPHIRKC